MLGRDEKYGYFGLSTEIKMKIENFHAIVLNAFRWKSSV